MDPDRGRAVRVLGFSEAAFDDPALDLAALSTSFGREAVLSAGGPESPGLLARVDFYEGTFALQEAIFGRENGDQDALRAGIEGIIARFSRR